MGISIWQLLIILLIVLLLFGAKRLRTLGSDLGSAVKGFRDALGEAEKEEQAPPRLERREGERLGDVRGDEQAGRTVEGEAVEASRTSPREGTQGKA